MVKPYANFKTAHFVTYLSSMLTDFHDTSITEFSFDEAIEMCGKPYANFKTAHFVTYLSPMLTDFHDISTTGFSFDETIEMRGNNSMLTLKMHVLLNILALA